MFIMNFDKPLTESDCSSRDPFIKEMATEVIKMKAKIKSNNGNNKPDFSTIRNMVGMDDEMAECTLNEIYELFDGARMVLEEMCIPFNVPMKELVLTESVVQIFITKLMELFGENKIVKSLLPKNKSSCSGDRDSSVVSEELAQ